MEMQRLFLFDARRDHLDSTRRSTEHVLIHDAAFYDWFLVLFSSIFWAIYSCYTRIGCSMGGDIAKVARKITHAAFITIFLVFKSHALVFDASFADDASELPIITRSVRLPTHIASSAERLTEW